MNTPEGSDSPPAYKKQTQDSLPVHQRTRDKSALEKDYVMPMSPVILTKGVGDVEKNYKYPSITGQIPEEDVIDATKRIPSLLAHLDKADKVVRAMGRWREGIKRHQIGIRRTYFAMPDGKKSNEEDVTTTCDRLRVLSILNSGGETSFFLYPRQSAAHPGTTLYGLQKNGYDDETPPNGQKKQPIKGNYPVDMSAKYHDGSTIVDVQKVDTAPKGTQVITVSELKNLITDPNKGFKDGEFVAAVAVYLFKKEIAEEGIRANIDSSVIDQAIEDISALPKVGNSPWFSIEDPSQAANAEERFHTEEKLADIVPEDQLYEQETLMMHPFIKPTSNEVLVALVGENDKGETTIDAIGDLQPKFYYKRRAIVCPGGGIDKEKQENLEQAALRELNEETGQDGMQVIQLTGPFYRSDILETDSTPMIILGAREAKIKLKGDEALRPIPLKYTINEWKYLIANGYVTDVGTIYTIFSAISYLEAHNLVKNRKN